MRWFRLAAEQGNESAQHYLKNLSATGSLSGGKTILLIPTIDTGTIQEALEALTRDGFASARAAFRMHAEQGDAVAQYHLGFMYVHGVGGPEDVAEAARWYASATVEVRNHQDGPSLARRETAEHGSVGDSNAAQTHAAATGSAATSTMCSRCGTRRARATAADRSSKRPASSSRRSATKSARAAPITCVSALSRASWRTTSKRKRCRP